MDEKLYTVQEVAKQFRVSRQAVYDWVSDGRLAALRIGERIRIPESALRAFVRAVEPGEKIGEKSGQTEAALLAA